MLECYGEATRYWSVMGSFLNLCHCVPLQEFLVEQGLITRARRAFDRALCALPITQHERIWQIYLVRGLPSLLASSLP